MRALLTLIALAMPVAMALAAPQPAVTVTQARMQVLIPSRPAAGYFTMRNQSDSELTLTGATAPDCASLMLHQSITDNGTARMMMVDTLRVPPHGSVAFSPGNYHLMCMQPSGPLLTHAGTEPVTFHFGGGGSVTVPFAIQGAEH